MTSYSDKELREIYAEHDPRLSSGCAKFTALEGDLARELLAARRALRDTRRIVTYWLGHPERGFLGTSAVQNYAASLAKIDRALGSRPAKKERRKA